MLRCGLSSGESDSAGAVGRAWDLGGVVQDAGGWRDLGFGDDGTRCSGGPGQRFVSGVGNGLDVGLWATVAGAVLASARLSAGGHGLA